MIKKITEEIKFKNGFDIKCPVIGFMNCGKNMKSVAQFCKGRYEHECNESLHVRLCLPADTYCYRRCKANK